MFPCGSQMDARLRHGAGKGLGMLQRRSAPLAPGFLPPGGGRADSLNLLGGYGMMARWKLGSVCENSRYSSPQECPGEAGQGFPARDPD